MRGKHDDPDFRNQLTPVLEKLLDEVNSQVEAYEQMQFLAVAREDWQIANDFLTPTLKIKRDVIEQAYASQLDSWYESGKKVIWQ
jgi:long-subunit acyl-CoA synthetase (AMP-forming)